MAKEKKKENVKKKEVPPKKSEYRVATAKELGEV